ncbi:hypothetical protein AKG95_29220 (plasmid) [Janthinobacterium lividum]|jgi:hypothetical protein|uniref:Uncharacterized protein n=1 Tax=Janthinobacterium lividum TaxID=29581 RepID=A0A1S1U3U7_9BURK|nr:hypothetical protein AKG95_29220 [Janthinobacterium lividum]
MLVSDIEEGKSYVDGAPWTYCRTVEMIVAASKRPGGKVVAWSTEGFSVRGRVKKMHGKCGIKTFATWAMSEAK